MTSPDARRWEFGSEFHWQPFPLARPAHPWGDRVRFGCGRDAIRSVIRRASARRLFVPTYFCPEVVDALAREVPVVGYPDAPDVPRIDLARVPAGSGDLVLVVNTLGLRAGCENRLPDGAVLLEDHSHDPWSSWAFRSRADYALASLRKTLPVADGAVVWSPRGLQLPDAPAPSAQRQLAVGSKLEAMILKGLYLAGASVEKPCFRDLAIAGEGAIASGEPAPISALSDAVIDCFPVQEWRRARRENHAALCEMLAPCGDIRILRALGDDSAAYVVALQLASQAARDALRAKLIASDVYPVVLWTISGDEPWSDLRAAEISSRFLGLSCDGRYARPDLERVAAIITSTR